MANELTMTGSKKLKTISSEFSAKFNYLTLQFRKANNHALDPELTLAAVREKKGADLSIVGNLSVGSLERRFEEIYGINVEVVYKNKEGRIFKTGKEADGRTLTAQNEAAKAEGMASWV